MTKEEALEVEKIHANNRARVEKLCEDMGHGAALQHVVQSWVEGCGEGDQGEGHKDLVRTHLQSYLEWLDVVEIPGLEAMQCVMDANRFDFKAQIYGETVAFRHVQKVAGGQAVGTCKRVVTSASGKWECRELQEGQSFRVVLEKVDAEGRSRHAPFRLKHRLVLRRSGFRIYAHLDGGTGQRLPATVDGFTWPGDMQCGS